MTLICGIEEAGRGPVIGPMVMAGVVIEQKDEQKLKNMGVKDSKLLTPMQREALFDRIKQSVIRYKIIILSPKEVDDSLNDPSMNLNWLEAETSVKLIDKLNPDEAILDCPSTNTNAYRDYVKTRLEKKIKIISEHKADVNYPVVSAASILAKVTRDREIEKIKDSINKEFGSGYPSDPRTIEFLDKNYDRYPHIFRKTWKTYQKVIANKKQKGLMDFK